MNEQTMPVFEWNAADYANQSSAQQVWAEELLAKLNLSGSEQVLDLGCGDGKVSAAIAACLTHGNVTGIDASFEMISLAKKAYVNSRNLNFKHDDATDFSYNEKFDVVFSNAVLHWVQDHVAVLKNCYQSLSHGGKVLLQMGGQGNAEEFIGVVTEVTAREKWKEYYQRFTFPYHFYATEDYENWLNNTGFKAIRIELINKDMQHVGKKGLAGWFRTTWMPYTNQLPEHKREEFITDVIDSYIKIYPVDKIGISHVKMVRLEVEAVKH